MRKRKWTGRIAQIYQRSRTPPQTYRCQKNARKQIPHRRPTNIMRHCTKFRRPSHLARGTCASLTQGNPRSLLELQNNTRKRNYQYFKVRALSWVRKYFTKSWGLLRRCKSSACWDGASRQLKACWDGASRQLKTLPNSPFPSRSHKTGSVEKETGRKYIIYRCDPAGIYEIKDGKEVGRPQLQLSCVALHSVRHVRGSAASTTSRPTQTALACNTINCPLIDISALQYVACCMGRQWNNSSRMMCTGMDTQYTLLHRQHFSNGKILHYYIDLLWAG